jgi:hypothetical protein
MKDESTFAVHHFRFEVEALTPLVLPAHPGPAFRAALFAALQRHFCPVPQSEAGSADHKAVCPVCWLMATEQPNSQRGRDVPRPYTVEPPVRRPDSPPPPNGDEPWRFEPGDRFAYGVTLLAQALNLFPYLVVATPLMGEAGLGMRLEENAALSGTPRRGRFGLRRIDAVNPLAGSVTAVLEEGSTTVYVPRAPVSTGDVRAASQSLLDRLDSRGLVTLRFWTPTRIIHDGRLAHSPWPGPIIRRLLERLDALRGEYGGEPPIPNRERLVELADRVSLVQDLTHWIDLESGSRRLGRSTPVGGFIGAATYQADHDTWRSLLPWLLWGQEVHVGKDATKGNGWYDVQIVDSG